VIPFAVIVFFGALVGGSGPTYQEWKARRQARNDQPTARVVLEYLPSSACREPASK
jgi:hypothetical protein